MFFVFAWIFQKTWKFHIPRVGMEYGNAQITASTLAQVHSDKSNRVVGDVCRHARNCNIPRGVPSSPWGVAWRQSALSSDARPQRMWKAQEMDPVPIVKTLIRALVNHGCWWSQDWRLGHSWWSFWCTTNAFCRRSRLWSCQQPFCSVVGRSGTVRCVNHSTFRYRATAVDVQRPQRVALSRLSVHS